MLTLDQTQALALPELSMSWLTQPRTLDISGAALPVWQDVPLFTVSRLAGSEKLGRLYDYTVELATIECPGLSVSTAQALVQIDKLVGTEVTVRIAIEGSGTYRRCPPLLNTGSIAPFGWWTIEDIRFLTGQFVFI